MVRKQIIYLKNLQMVRKLIILSEGTIVVVIVWLDLQLPLQSVPIITNVVSSNIADGEVYLIQHYVIKFVSDLQQVSGFLWVLWFPPPIKLTHDITGILLKVTLDTITQKPFLLNTCTPYSNIS